jgi:hypothetical protein
MERLHPDAFDGSRYVAGTPSISWPVKLGWATDIAVAAAWLHARAIVGCDLMSCSARTATVRLSTTVRYTLGWCAPEAIPPNWEAIVEGDVFALGLVLWCIAVEVPTVHTTRQLPLKWSEGTPG